MIPVDKAIAVKRLQQALNDQGIAVDVSGQFDPNTDAAVRQFQSENQDVNGRPLVVDGSVGPSTWWSLSGLTVPLSRDAATPAAVSHAGFDTSQYPGDNRMPIWKESSPYEFVGYYLRSPCHQNTSWMGKRATLTAMGWNLLVIYVGQQAPGVSPCGKNQLTSAQGLMDGAEATQTAAAEGFPAGTFIYLDVEAMDPGSGALAGMSQYVQAWVGQVIATPYLPAVYCHKKNAPAIQAAVSAGGAPASTRFWVVGSGDPPFDISTSRPTDAGVTFATVWQCPVSIAKTFGGVTLNIDEDVATSPNPSS